MAARVRGREVQATNGLALYLYDIGFPEPRGLRMLAIRLPIELEQRLEALARATGRTKSYYAREAILAHLDDLEDVYLAEQRLVDLRAGRTQAVGLEELMQRHGVED